MVRLMLRHCYFVSVPVYETSSNMKTITVGFSVVLSVWFY